MAKSKTEAKEKETLQVEGAAAEEAVEEIVEGAAEEKAEEATEKEAAPQESENTPQDETPFAALLAKMEAMEKRINSLAEENEMLRSDAPQPIKPADPAMEELIPIQLFKDKGKYKDDVFVAVNGERILIKRGVPVMVKAKYAKVLERSIIQDAETADLITEKSEEWEQKAKLLNM